MARFVVVLVWFLLLTFCSLTKTDSCQRGAGGGGTVDIMEILSVASSEEGGAWRPAPQRGKYLQSSHQAGVSSS